MLEDALDNLNKNFRKIFKYKTIRVENLKKRIHHGIKCDYCNRVNFEGDRLCCTICDNYNLCAECFALKNVNKSHNVSHPCLLMVHPHTGHVGPLEVESRSDQGSVSSSQASESGSSSTKTSTATSTNDLCCARSKSVRFDDFKLNNLINAYKDVDFNIMCNVCEKKIFGVYLKCNKCYCTYVCIGCWETKKHDNSHQMIVYKSFRLEKFDYDQVKLGNMIGNGNFGYVYEAILKPFNNFVACKLLDKKFAQSYLSKFNQQKNLKERFSSIDKELQAYVEIYSPFICKLFGYGRDKSSNLFLIMEYMDNGTLEDLMSDEKKGLVQISWLTKLNIMCNIACGLADIHNKNLIHADIKPKNILLDKSYIAKICDLGSIKNANNNTFDNQIGGLFYLPLEFYLGKYDNKIDIYSFGLIMYHLFSGKRHSYTLNNTLVLDYLGKIELNFVRCLVEMAANFNIIERKTIYLYRNFLKNYLKVLDDLMVMFDFKSDYESMNIFNQNLLVLTLNDYILEFIQANYAITKLDVNGKIEVDELAFTDELKSKLEKGVKHLKRLTNTLKLDQNNGKQSIIKNIETQTGFLDISSK